MRGGELTLTILGSGTSTGVPVPGCRCAICCSPDPRDQRTRCSALLSWRGRNILIDTATDLRQQVLRLGLTHIDAVLYTHTHADHVHGIDDLRTFSWPDRPPLPVFASPEALGALQRVFTYIFSEPAEPGYRPNLAAWAVGGEFSIFGLPVLPLELEHGTGTALGYRFGPLAYLTDCSAIPEAAERQLQGLELLVIDALRFRPHPTHFHIAAAIEVSQRLGAKRTLLTHLSHDVEYARDNPGLPAGVELAYDGQTATLQLPSAPGE